MCSWESKRPASEPQLLIYTPGSTAASQLVVRLKEVGVGHASRVKWGAPRSGCYPSHVGTGQLLKGTSLRPRLHVTSTINCGTIMTMRHEREDTGQRGAGRPKNSPLWTVCGLSCIPAPPGLLFLLVHRGAQRALSYGTESCFFSVINLRPPLTWARRLGEQFPVHAEGKSVLPKGSLLPAHLVCLSTRPQAPRGQRRWLSLSHPFIHLFIHLCIVWTLVCARPCAGCLCGLLVWWEVRARPGQGGTVLGLQGQNAIPGALCPAEGGVGAACGADVLGQVPVSYKLYLLICKAAASEGGCEEPRMRVHVAKKEHSCSVNMVSREQSPR